MRRRFSLACRAITVKGEVVVPGHGGRWGDKGDRCPSCGRVMTVTGAVTIRKVHDD